MKTLHTGIVESDFNRLLEICQTLVGGGTAPKHIDLFALPAVSILLSNMTKEILQKSGKSMEELPDVEINRSEAILSLHLKLLLASENKKSAACYTALRDFDLDTIADATYLIWFESLVQEMTKHSEKGVPEHLYTETNPNTNN